MIPATLSSVVSHLITALFQYVAAHIAVILLITNVIKLLVFFAQLSHVSWIFNIGETSYEMSST